MLESLWKVEEDRTDIKTPFSTTLLAKCLILHFPIPQIPRAHVSPTGSCRKVLCPHEHTKHSTALGEDLRLLMLKIIVQCEVIVK